MKHTRIHLEWRETPVRQFRTGVSLHSHTLHSRETLDFIYRLARRVGWIRSVLAEGERRYRRHYQRPLDLRQAWWTPPCAPYDAWLLETRHIEQRFQLNPLISITDHDNIEAPLALRALESCGDIPISVEWTVPFAGTFFHLGIHNLHTETAPQIFRELAAFTATNRTSDLGALLESLAANPEILIVFNHPCWDEQGIGADRHAEIAAYFLRSYGRFLHALELNGLRPWKENRQVLQMAHALGKAVVAGGDRHALEPNAILDLTNAATFSEYVEQVRAGCSDVLITAAYREPFASRIFRSLEEILQDYESHGRGWRCWTDRVFYRCEDGVARPLTALFPRSIPGAIQFFVQCVALVRQCGIQRTFRWMLPRRQEFAW